MNWRLYISLIVIFSIIFIGSCINDTPNTENKKLSFKDKNINRHVYRAKNMQNELIVNVNYLIPINGQKNIQNIIDTVTYKTIASYLSEYNKSGNIVDSEEKLLNLTNYYVDTFCNGEVLDKKEKWEMKIKEELTFQSNNIVSLEFNSYQLSGNSKSIPSTVYKNFDKNKSQTISLKNLTNNKIKELTQIGELEFRRKYKIHPNENLANTPFMFFENNTFKLPDNFTFTKMGITFVYNVYEISPYSEGKISFTVPYDNIKDILDVEYITSGGNFK